MDTLDVARDGNVNVLSGRVSVTEGDYRDVHITALHDGLVVGTRVGHYQQTGLLVGSLDLVSECTRGKSASDSGGSSVQSELQDGSLRNVWIRDLM